MRPPSHRRTRRPARREAAARARALALILVILAPSVTPLGEGAPVPEATTAVSASAGGSGAQGAPAPQATPAASASGRGPQQQGALPGGVRLPQEEKRLAIYFLRGQYALRVLDRENAEYVNLLDLLAPLGSARTKADGRKWKVRLDGKEAQFEEGATRVKLRGRHLQLENRFLTESGRPLIPLKAAAAVLSYYLDVAVVAHDWARRIFLGDTASPFKIELRKGEPSSLVLSFAQAVSPRLHSEGGSLRMVFSREPIVSPTPQFMFNDKLIRSASFSESNGAAEIAVAGNAPLIASFSDGGRTITLSAAPGPAAQTTPPVAPPPGPLAPSAPAPAPAPATGAPLLPPSALPAAHYQVVIDPGHGGSEPGATLAANVEEKEVTLALARRLRAELQNRGLSAMLLRDADNYISLDQRAATVNGLRPLMFVSLHAATSEAAVRVYTALLPAAQPEAGVFRPWESAQEPFLERSRLLASSLSDELRRRDVQVLMLPAPLRPLNNVTTAAVAVEVCLPGNEPAGFTAAYQQSLAAWLATALANVRGKLEAANSVSSF